MAVANRDRVSSLDRHLVHDALHRVRPIAGKTVDAAPDQKMRAEFLGQAKQLVDVALAIADVDAPSRVAEQRGGPAHVVEPADALLALDRDAGRVDLPLQGGGA